jgi:dTDP-4-amino-4,6-dideoxygalactose transaminase
LNRREIGVAVNYRSVPTLTYYREKYGYRAESFPVSYEWGASTLTLPLFPTLEREKQEWVITSLLEDVVPLCRDAGKAPIAELTTAAH